MDEPMRCGGGGARRADLIARTTVVVGLIGWGVGSYLYRLFTTDPAPGPSGAGLAVALLNIVLFALLITGLRGRRAAGSDSRRPLISCLLAALPVAMALVLVNPDFDGPLYLCMPALWALSTRLSLRWGLATGAVLVAAVASLGHIAGGSADLGLLIAFAGVALGGVATRQGMAAQQAARRAEAANAVLAERSRIAREIHDILAHSLSAQVVHLEGARLLLSRDGDRVQALDRVERARNLARSGLEETRRALATLRGEIPEPREVIAELAEDFYVSTGRPCDVQVTGTARELSAQAGLTVVRTAQEALTNVRKHAPGARAHVCLRYLKDTVELEITDTGGTEPGLDLGGGGYGLVGMRERAELIDGTLETGPNGKGFRVALRVPVG
ncbi:sensor histidine kinase [Actinomadura algeriensis]|uniref:histidine kinase n=1 Tax=Actinomadura algeriensis TaxID=1679523 RepID=A0ABR9K6D8_9ACTN|nr:histidine kinase [Actinomadura algeriensis]MBE1537930.1 signal transduction histidine kinase [Actinomadura algeriensis]